MIREIYQKTFSVLKQKPLRLWGMSLLFSFLCGGSAVAFGVVPIVGAVIALVLEAGMCMVYLAGYRGEGFETENLFRGFQNGRFGRVAGGMAWMLLWIVLWGLIPIVGIVFAVIKTYQYRFTPYILMTRPEVKTLDAIKVSKAETEGFKGKMFLAELIFCAILYGAVLVFYVLGLIPYVGVVFKILMVLLALLIGIFAGLFLGIMQAAFYDEVQKTRRVPAYNEQLYTAPAPQQPASDQTDPAPAFSEVAYPGQAQPDENAPFEDAQQDYPAEDYYPEEQPVESGYYCPVCGASVDPDAAFCPSCGARFR